jgi:hypothetical protein
MKHNYYKIKENILINKNLTQAIKMTFTLIYSQQCRSFFPYFL